MSGYIRYMKEQLYARAMSSQNMVKGLGRSTRLGKTLQCLENLLAAIDMKNPVVFLEFYTETTREHLFPHLTLRRKPGEDVESVGTLRRELADAWKRLNSKVKELTQTVRRAAVASAPEANSSELQSQSPSVQRNAEPATQ